MIWSAAASWYREIPQLTQKSGSLDQHTGVINDGAPSDVESNMHRRTIFGRKNFAVAAAAQNQNFLLSPGTAINPNASDAIFVYTLQSLDG